ncbi:MAG: alpha-galactosidase [Anaerolineae bacterium]|nr:alpha-galactosidase [Anaerolineae bacterium]
MPQPWQCLHSPPPGTDILRAGSLPVSFSQMQLEVAWRGSLRPEREALPLALDPLASTEDVAFFRARSTLFAVELRFYLNKPRLLLNTRLTPLGSEAPLLETLTLRVGTARVGAHGRRMRVFKQGHQSWSETRSFDSREREGRAVMRWLDVMQANPRNRAANRRGEFTSEMMVLFHNPEQNTALLLGQQAPFGQMLSFRSGFPAESAAQNEFALAVTWDLNGQRLEPGKPHELDPVACLVGADPAALMAAYMDSLQQRSLPQRQLPSGWCSWYYYYTRINAEEMRANADCAAEHQVDWQFFVLDDGYQRAISDWLKENEKFSEGLKPLAAHISARGFRPGIWTAPFITMKNSRLAQDHPDWLLQQPYRERPVVAGWNPNWGGTFYALDVTHPGVQDYLRQVYRTLVKHHGFRFLKLDFVYAASLAGRPYNPNLSGAERLSLGYHIIREEAGEDTVILGCGSPLTPAIGYVDAMRIGPDVAPYWQDWLRTVLTRDSNALSTKNAIRSILNRAAMHRKLWVNDPDCLMLRDTETRLNRDERLCLVNAAIITAGMGVFSDRLSALPDGTWEEIARIRELTLACDSGQCFPLDFMERPMPELVYNDAGFLAVFNFADWAAEKEIPLHGLLRHAIPAGSRLHEQWNGQTLAAAEDHLALGVLPPHASRLYRIEVPV